MPRKESAALWKERFGVEALRPASLYPEPFEPSAGDEDGLIEMSSSAASGESRCSPTPNIALLVAVCLFAVALLLVI